MSNNASPASATATKLADIATHTNMLGLANSIGAAKLAYSSSADLEMRGKGEGRAHAARLFGQLTDGRMSRAEFDELVEDVSEGFTPGFFSGFTEMMLALTNVYFGQYSK